MAITKTGIEVDTSSSFTNPSIYEENGQVNQVTADSLTPSTRYYTRAYVINDGSTIYSQNMRSFTTATPEYFYFGNPDSQNSITVQLKKVGSPADFEYEYSISDGTNWTSGTTRGISSQSFLIPAGKKIIFRGTNSSFSTGASNYYYFDCSDYILVGGNIMTLLDPTGMSTTIPCTYCFYSAFKGITDLDNGGLELPATELKDYCYAHLFDGCAAMTSPPELPATELATGCYSYMFNACSRIETTPELVAKSVANYAYLNMFNGARSLNRVICYAETWNTNNSAAWLQNAGSGSGDFYNLGRAQIPLDSNSGIPTGWTEYTSL